MLQHKYYLSMFRSLNLVRELEHGKWSVEKLRLARYLVGREI